MKALTSEEIERALECCQKDVGNCRECPFMTHKIDCLYNAEAAYLKEIKRLKAENKQLMDEWNFTFDSFNQREYRKKFIEEVWKGEMGNELSSPDGDFIYKLYFEERNKNKQLRKEIAAEILQKLNADLTGDIIHRSALESWVLTMIDEYCSEEE